MCKNEGRIVPFAIFLQKMMLPGKAILARNNRVTTPRPHKKMKHVLYGLLIFYGYQNHCSDVHFGGSRSQLSSTNKK